MPPSVVGPADLLDLKLLPAWMKEPAGTKNYEHYEGDTDGERPRRRDHRSHDRQERSGKRSTPRAGKGPRSGFGRTGGRDQRPDGARDRQAQDRHPPVPQTLPEITIRFMPRSPAFESVVEQIKTGSVAYSLFHLARLFLEKPERYDVRLKPKVESPLFQIGENGAVSFDRQSLDQNAFRLVQEDFYKVDITQGEPIKGNFSSVARDRLSGILLGPTNYHAYQPRLRTLYEQRFSRRMSFADYQRQIEIVNDPALVERWKEEAQRVTTYTTLREETPGTFSSAAEVERHFRTNYLPGLLRSVEEITTSGVLSRGLPDRALNRAIEDAWTREIRSPSNMMQELAGRIRQAGLHIFRHRRGMLFVSPIRVRALVHEQTGVSTAVNAILGALAETPGINRKELAGKLIVDPAAEEAESRKLALASDLHWLISEGHVIEFNDGSLDLPRGKAKAPETLAEQTPETKSDKDVAAAVAPITDAAEQPMGAASADGSVPVAESEPEDSPTVESDAQ